MRAWVFPGQGSQKRGMGREVFRHHSSHVAIADRILGYSIEELCLEDPLDRLNRTKYTQPALYVVNALSAMQEGHRASPAPAFCAGFSLGEYNALLAAGAFDFATGLRLVEKRASLMDEAAGGAMAAVIGLPAEDLQSVIDAIAPSAVVIANHNTPDQLVLSGPKAEVDRVRRSLERHPGVSAVVPLRTSGAFHSPEMRSAADAFAAFVEEFSFSDLSVPVISNVTGRPHRPENLKASLAEQIVRPVRWSDSVRYLLARGVDAFTEIGGTSVLRPMIEAIRRTEPVVEPPPPPVPPRADAAPLLAEILRRCTGRPGEVAQIFHGDRGAVEVRGGQIAAEVRRLGERIGARAEAQDRVVLLLPHGPALSRALLACWYAGTVAVPVPFAADREPGRAGDAIPAVLRDSGARWLLASAASAPAARVYAREFGLGIIAVEASDGEDASPLRRRPPDRGDAAVLLYTSGSTSQPKGVVLSHATVLNSALSPQWAMSERSRVVSWLPLHHAFGLNLGLLAPLAHGALSVLAAPEGFVSAPRDWLALIDRHRATHTGGPSFLFGHCCAALDDAALEGLDLSSLESLICGGDLIRFADCERFTRLLAPCGLRDGAVLPHYGLSEAAPVTLHRPGEPMRTVVLEEAALLDGRVRPAPGGRRVVSCGEIDGSTRIEIVDHGGGGRCPGDRVGEVWVKTPCAAAGYWGAPEASRRTFDAALGDTGERGFLRTGDLGFVADNHLYIVGRLKDVIVANGKNHHPVDLEAAVGEGLGRPGLACAAFAYEAEHGQRIAVVQEVDGDAPGRHREIGLDIVDLVSRRFQLQVHDVALVPRGAVPLTASRKVRRQACCAMLRRDELPVLWRWDGRQGLERPASAGPPHGAATVAASVRDQVLLPLLGAPARDLSVDDPISRLGVDSIQYIKIARKIEQVFGTRCPPSAVYTNNSCSLLARFIEADAGAPAETPAAPRWARHADDAVVGLLVEYADGRMTTSRILDLIRERL